MASLLYSWQHPPTLNAPSDVDLEAHRKAVHDFFAFDAMAYCVLNAVVATAVRYSEIAKLSIPERERQAVEREVRTAEILKEYGLSK